MKSKQLAGIRCVDCTCLCGTGARQGIAELISKTLGVSGTVGVGETQNVDPAEVVSSIAWRSFSDALLQESVFLFQDAMGRLGDLRGMQVHSSHAAPS